MSRTRKVRFLLTFYLLTHCKTSTTECVQKTNHLMFQSIFNYTVTECKKHCHIVEHSDEIVCISHTGMPRVQTYFWTFTWMPKVQTYIFKGCSTILTMSRTMSSRGCTELDDCAEHKYCTITLPQKNYNITATFSHYCNMTTLVQHFHYRFFFCECVCNFFNWFMSSCYFTSYYNITLNVNVIRYILIH